MELLKVRIREYLRESVSEKRYLKLKKLGNGLVSLMYRSNLNKLASIHGTDKWNDHWYTQHYQHHFSPWRKRKLQILEIGIGGYDDPIKGGDSLRMWKSYFPNAEIHGLDIIDKTLHEESRIKVHVGSQIDLEFLGNVVKLHGPFDIIIDDGSHMNEHVIETFNYLFLNGLKSNGIYVVEDTQTSYWNNFGGDESDLQDPRTMMNMFKQLTDVVNCQDYLFNPKLSSPFDHFITSIHFYHNLIFFYKGDPRHEERFRDAFR